MDPQPQPTPRPARRRKSGGPIQKTRVDCFLLADAAQAVGGKLFILGGGWNIINLPGPDTPVPAMALAIRIIIPWLETNQELNFTIQLEDADRNKLLGESPRILLNVGRPPTVDPGFEQAIPFAMDLHGLTFQRKGDYAFTIELDGNELARTVFTVNLASPLSSFDPRR